MSGKRDHFGKRLSQEIGSALALLFRQVKTGALETRLPEPDLTYYATDWQPGVYGGAVPETPVDVVYDALDPEPAEVREFPLLPVAVELHADTCAWEATVSQTPVWAEGACVMHAVGFDGVASLLPRPPLAWPTAAPTSPRVQASPVSQPAPRLTSWPIPRLAFGERVRSLNVSRWAARLQAMPARLWSLPIRRQAIPPHRLLPAQKDFFRRQLAEKAGTVPANIQLQMIYDRLDVTLFSSIDQDDRGNLVCYPKPELTGRGALRASQAAPLACLVFGTRVDNRQTVRMLVPQDQLPGAEDDAGDGRR